MTAAGTAFRDSTLAWLRHRASLAALIALSVLLIFAALSITGTPPLRTLLDLADSSVGSGHALSGTLREMMPLLLCGIAVFIALRAGLFNIGVEGQFTVGALAAAVTALRVPGPFGIALAALAGAIGGGLWALPAGAIKAYKGGHEVITTIMLNNIAALLATALVAGPLKSPTEESPQTSQLSSTSFLPDCLLSKDLSVGSGVFLGLAIVLALSWWLRRTVAGYELEVVGANATAARFAGIRPQRVVMRAMLWSGAIGGLAGALQVLGFEHYFYPGVSSGYGFDALGVALLAGSSPWGLIPSALLFGALNKGGTSIQVLDNVPKGITFVILGLLIVIAAAIRFRKTRTSDA